VTPALAVLADYAAGLRLNHLPADVVAKARTCLIDTLFGCFLVGRDERPMAALRSVPLDGPRPASTIVGSRHRAAPADAAFVNAISTAASDRSDTHRPTAVHPGLVVVPAALALAETEGLGGAALIEAIVAGYEVMGRLARALVRPELVAVFRPTPLAGATAGAVAAARVLGLPASQIVAAAALNTHTAAGFNEWVHAGTGEHPFHSGFTGRNAVTSALLARAGATAAATVLDGPSGLLAGFGALARADGLTRDLGGDFEIRQVVHKPAPACFFVQAPCQVAERLVRDNGIRPQDIDRVEIRTTATAARYPGCDNAGPMVTQQDAIMSLQFSVASVLMHGRIAEDNWTDYADPSVAALAARSTVVEDALLTGAQPAQGVAVTLTLRNGWVLEERQDDFRSMSPDEVDARFLLHAEPCLGHERATRALAVLRSIEDLPDVRTLTGLLRAGT
jgi:2-methylcitrate dehydratase PrpD